MMVFLLAVTMVEPGAVVLVVLAADRVLNSLRPWPRARPASADVWARRERYDEQDDQMGGWSIPVNTSMSFR